MTDPIIGTTDVPIMPIAKRALMAGLYKIESSSKIDKKQSLKFSDR